MRPFFGMAVLLFPSTSKAISSSYQTHNLTDPHPSIAVLPFANSSANGELDFFCDGITEEIINALAKIEELKVISRTSSFFFKDHKATLQDIAKQLDVSTILEGSVRFAGDQMRITAQLINVADDSHFWSMTWDRKLENIFAIQDEISLLIADKLREHFGHLEISEHIAQSPTLDLEAYAEYLKGKRAFNLWNPTDVQTSIEHYEKALALDPNLIDAHVGLADGYSFLGVAGFAPREEAWQKAIDHIEQAEAINPEHAPLNYIQANRAFFTDADFATSMRFIKRAITKKPSYSEGNQFIAFLYMLKGDLKQARQYILYAKSIDPLNQETLFYEAYFHYRSRAYNDAMSILDDLLASNAMNVPAIVLKAYVLLQTDGHKELDALLKSVPEEMIMPDERLGLRCLSLYMQGQHDETLAHQLIHQANSDSSHQAHSYCYLFYCISGQLDGAFAMLEKLFEQQSSVLLLSFSGPLAEAIQEDARYESYHERIYPSTLEVVSSEKRSRSSALNDEVAAAYEERLSAFMNSENPYLNPGLTLRSLAEQIEIHPNQLSWLLNERLGVNFNEFVNEKRVEHFKRLAIDPDNAHISLIGLAYESGFNSKTVFNTTFKKMTGMTPGAYQKSQKGA